MFYSVHHTKKRPPFGTDAFLKQQNAFLVFSNIPFQEESISAHEEHCCIDAAYH